MDRLSDCLIVLIGIIGAWFMVSGFFGMTSGIDFGLGRIFKPILSRRFGNSGTFLVGFSIIFLLVLFLKHFGRI